MCQRTEPRNKIEMEISVGRTKKLDMNRRLYLSTCTYGDEDIKNHVFILITPIPT